jgi:hypothetical protein
LASGLEPYRAAGRTVWESAARMLEAELGRALAASASAAADYSAMRALVEARLGVSEDEDLATRLDVIDSERAGYQAARGAALDAMAQAYVRAHPVLEVGFDKDKFVARARGWTLAEIHDETETLAKVARAALGGGAHAPRAIDPRGSDPTQGEAATSRVAVDPALYRS